MRMQMFPNLAARETCVAETNFAAWKQKVFSPGVKNIFASRTQILRPKHMFLSLATPGNITRNIRDLKIPRFRVRVRVRLPVPVLGYTGNQSNLRYTG